MIIADVGRRLAPARTRHPGVWDALGRVGARSEVLARRATKPFASLDPATCAADEAPFIGLRSLECTESLRLAPRGSYLLPDHGWIVTPHFGLEPDSVIDADWHRAQRPGLRRHAIERLHRTGRADLDRALSLRSFGELNHFHVVNDLLGGRLRLADEHGLGAELPIVVSELFAASPLFRALQSAPRLRDRRWVVQPPRQLVRVEELYFAGTTEYPTGRVPEYLWALLGIAESDRDAHDRLLVLRRPGSPRALTNEAEVRDLGRRFGFRAVDPGALSFWEQVEAFSRARVVIAAHGAALTNVVFRRSAPLSVIELVPDHNPLAYAHYFHLCRVLGHEHTTVLTRASDRSPAAGLIVDVSALEAQVVSALDRVGSV